MKLFLITITAALLLPFLSSAQSNYKPGYVVDIKGDTLKGSVDYLEWERNPKQVTFKSTTGTVQQFTPQSSNAFAVTGFEYFEKHVVKISMDPIEATSATNMLDTSYRVDTVFLKTMTKGRYLSLYSYSDAVKTRFYAWSRGDAEPTELAYHVYLGTNSAPVHVNRYRFQLQNIASGNNVNGSKLAGLLSESAYTDRDLLRIAAAINGTDPSQLKSGDKVGTRFFVGAGVNYNGMSFSGDIEFPSNYSVFPKVSAGIDIFTNKNVQRLFVRVEIGVTGDQHDSKNSYERSELKMQQVTASLALQAYYNFYNGQNLKVFAGGGLSLNNSTYPTHYYITLGGIDVTPIKQNNFPDYYKLWETILLKAGVTINNRIEIYAGYVPSTTITDQFLAFDGRVTSYQAGVNFLFGAK